jgi:hypothetical protein
MAIIDINAIQKIYHTSVLLVRRIIGADDMMIE